MQYFDTHAHYEDEKFDIDREDIIKKIYEAGVTKCINVGCNVETSIQSVNLANEYDFIYAICGIHPIEIADTVKGIENQISEIKKIVKNSKKVVAIGEIGLDYHYVGINKEMQKLAFRRQIDLANELNLPISIHTRDAIDDTIEILRNYKINKKGVLHCCPFNRELVKHGLENDLYIAFGGTSTFKNSRNANEIVNMVPNDKLLIETDAPYLAPEPYRGTRNDSSNLRYVVEKLAEYKNKTSEEIARITYENAYKIFDIEGG